MAGEALHAGSHLGEEKREHALGVRVRLPVNCPGRELSTRPGRRQTLPRRACWLLDLRLPEYHMIGIRKSELMITKYGCIE